MAITYDPTTADIGELTRVPAGDVIIDLNVREDIRLDKSFVSSIRVRGFEQYPVGFVDEHGKAHVTVGQRRVSAALEIGWEVIPMVVKSKLEAEADRVEEQRLLTQLAENEHRTGLRESEVAAGYRQLALVGVSEDQIARKTNSPKARVQAGLKVASSKDATAAAATFAITLDQAAIFTEFEGDEAAIEQMRSTAETNPERLEHRAQQIRNERLDEEVKRRLNGDVVAAGATVWDSNISGAESIDSLWRADDPERTRLTFAKAKKYDGLIGRVLRSGWGSTDGPDRGFKIVWYLTGWKAQGLTTYGVREALTDEERADRKQKRVDKVDMIAATEVRRRWITESLLARGRKLTDPTMHRWIARELWHAPGTLRPSYGIADTLALTLLGHTEQNASHERDSETGQWLYGNQAQIRDLIDTEDPTRVSLAFAIAQTEQVVGDPKSDSFGRDTRARAYLRHLRDWGYQLSDVETRIITDPTTALANGEGLSDKRCVGSGGFHQ